MELSSVMINLSWYCDFASNPKTSCPYCWVASAHPGRNKTHDKPVELWLDAILKHIPPSATIDFVGGEPTIVPGFHSALKQLSKTHRWALTTNMGGDKWKIFNQDRLVNGVSWTASYHHTNPDSIEDFAEKCLALSSHYPISVNLVEYPTYSASVVADKLRGYGLKVFISPFEDVNELNIAGPLPLSCNGGQAHAVIDPEGFMYKCLSQERRIDRDRWRFGNIFEDCIQWPTKRSICFIPCDQYYILDVKHATKDMWGLDVREIEVPENIDLEAHRKSFYTSDGTGNHCTTTFDRKIKS